MKKYLLLLTILFPMLGCLTLEDSDIQALPENKGIVIIDVEEANTSKFELLYKPNVAATDLSGLIHINTTIMTRDSYNVIIATEGDYIISKATIDGDVYDFPKNSGFKVERGKVNYIGDFKLEFKESGIDFDILATVFKDENTLTSAIEALPTLGTMETSINILEIKE